MKDICLKGVGKRYGKPVLSGLNLVIPAGRTTAVMAPSGWGKTTLLRLLMGLETPDEGEITGLEGLRIAVCFQEDRLMPRLSAVDNIRLVCPELRRADILPRLERFALADAADVPAEALSGGMRRRAALLRALLAPADLVLLDEPFNALDEDTRARVTAETKALLHSRTAVIVTHDKAEAEAAGAEGWFYGG